MGHSHRFLRRDVLKASATLVMAAAVEGMVYNTASAAAINVPTIDKLSVRVLVDSASDIFFRPQEIPGIKVEPGRPRDAKRPLHSEWGLSPLLEPQRGSETRSLAA